MTLALICSGQGGQHAAMFERLAAEPAAESVLDDISRHAGFDVRRSAEFPPEDALAHNRLAQALVVGHAAAAHAALLANGVRPAVVAGYSVGEISAHVVAGVWTAAQGLEIAARRAALMDEAAALAGGVLRMTAIIGIDVATANQLALDCGVELAIVNGPLHVVMGGPVDAIARFEALAQAHGASHVRRLSVHIASHTGFIRAAGPAFAEALAAADWKAPEATLLSGLDGRVLRSKADSVELLSRQIHQPLQWWDCVQSLFEHGVDVVLELGPGRALAKMIEESCSGIPVRSFDEFRSAAGAASWIRRHLPASSQ